MDALADLRSDTVTRPSEAMRRAMASADVGDDVFGEDPTVRRLEERVAALLGKPAALFVPSGTMANQLALLLHTQRGDEVIVGEGAHCANYESGAGAALSGVQFATAGLGGLFTAGEMVAAVRPVADWYPRTRVVALENTHNRGGGRIFPQNDVVAVAAVARRHGCAVHLDGARLWNAHVATGAQMSVLAEPFDTVSVCLSKGLGAPVGSLLAGSSEALTRGRRLRKMLGGGMRQVGVIAAAGLYAVEYNVARLAEDHAHARWIHAAVADALGEGTPVPDTNIVMVDLPDGRSAESFCSQARERGVLVSAFGPSRVRVVTHLDVDAAAARRAADVLAAVVRTRG